VRRAASPPRSPARTVAVGAGVDALGSTVTAVSPRRLAVRRRLPSAHGVTTAVPRRVTAVPRRVLPGSRRSERWPLAGHRQGDPGLGVHGQPVPVLGTVVALRGGGVASTRQQVPASCRAVAGVTLGVPGSPGRVPFAPGPVPQ
jgi:hypothetical protein